MTVTPYAMALTTVLWSSIPTRQTPMAMEWVTLAIFLMVILIMMALRMAVIIVQ